MSDDLLLVVGISVAVVMLVVALLWNFFQERRHRRQWGVFAERYGMTFQPATWLRADMMLYGLFRGHHIRLDREVVQSGRSKTYYSVYQVRLSEPWKCGIKIRNREFSDRVAAKFRGLKGYRVGVDEFDEGFLIERPVPPELEQALKQTEVQDALLRVANLGGRMRVEGGLLRVRQIGTTSKAIEMKMIFDRLCDAAELLDEAAAGPLGLEAQESLPDQVSAADDFAGVAW